MLRGRVCLFMPILLLFFLCQGNLYAGQEVLKTSKVSVGEKVPLTETLWLAHREGKAIILVLRSNFICKSCEGVERTVKEAIEVYGDKAAYIVKGSEAIGFFNEVDKEAIELKRLYGFVTMGHAWTFIIDKKGVLRKIFIGLFTKQELEDILSKILEDED